MKFNFRSLLKKLVLKLANLTEFSYVDEVYNSETGKVEKRWVLMIPGAGCQWAKEHKGGCYMCGFKYQLDYLKGKRNKPSKFQMFLAYFLGSYFANVKAQKPSQLAIYNGGSFFNDNEVPISIQNYLMKKISKKHPSIKSVLVESRPEYIDLERIKYLKSLLGENCSLVVGFGLECQSDKIREICINKGFNRGDYENAVKMLKDIGIKVLTYVFLKPILITEREAIKEAIATIDYAFSKGSNFVALQSAFIQEGTVMCKFYKIGKFTPPWLWSIISVVRGGYKYGPIHIGSFHDEPAPIAVPYNCPKCSDKVMKEISEYNRTHNISVFDDLKCSCQEDWLAEVHNVLPPKTKVKTESKHKV